MFFFLQHLGRFKRTNKMLGALQLHKVAPLIIHMDSIGDINNSGIVMDWIGSLDRKRQWSVWIELISMDASIYIF